MEEMKNSFINFYFAIILILIGCAPAKVKTTDANNDKSKYVTNDNSKFVTVKGKIEISGSYCGGAAPPEEMLREIKKKKPFADYKLYIRVGKKNDLNAPIIDSTITNSKGEFEFQLKQGEYLLISENQKNKNIFSTYKNNESYDVDMDCMEKWWQNGISKLTIDNQPIDEIYFHFKKKCFLPLNIFCLQFKGPYPP